MEETESLSTEHSPSDPVKFIIMDSQCESEDPDLMHLPALQMTKLKKSTNIDKVKALFEDPATTSIEKKNVKVLVSDSEYDSHHTHSRVEKKANSSSDSIIVVESEDQGISEDNMETTVIERKTKAATDEKSDSGSSFASNSKQDLGKFTTAEVSHSQGSKVRGHLFCDMVDSSEVDLFKDGEGEDVPNTPAEHIGSLQLSAQPMLVPETVDDDICALSPSQENFPHVIPGSPSSDQGEDEKQYDPTAEQTLSDPSVDFNTTKVKSSQKSEKLPSETQESFHLHLSCTESVASQEKIPDEPSVQVLDKSAEDVIVISQSEDPAIDINESQEFVLRLSQSEPSEKSKSDSKSEASKSIDSKSESSEGFLLKLPSDSDIQQSNKGSQEQRSQHSQGQKSSQGQPRISGRQLRSSQQSNAGSQQKSLKGQEESQLKGQMSSEGQSRTGEGHYMADEDMVTQTPPLQQEVVNSQKQTSSQRTPVKQASSLTIEMITSQSQNFDQSEHSFKLNRPEVQVGSEPSEDLRQNVFSKVKSADKTGSRYVIHDDSDDEDITFKSNKNVDSNKEDNPPKLKMLRTMSSEVTSTGYQGSVESQSQTGDITSNGAIAKQREINLSQTRELSQAGGDASNAINIKDSHIDSERTQSYDHEGYIGNKKTVEISKSQDNQSHFDSSGNKTVIEVNRKSSQSSNSDKKPSASQSSQPCQSNIRGEENMEVDVNLNEPQKEKLSSQRTPQKRQSSQDTQLRNTPVKIKEQQKQKSSQEGQNKTVVIKPTDGFKTKDVNIRTSRSENQTCDNKSGAQPDPYEFHGSQSQANMGGAEAGKDLGILDYYKTRNVAAKPGETPPSSRKRKRLVHKKTGQKPTGKRKPPVKKPATTQGHHVCFSSPVSQVMTTPPTHGEPLSASANTNVDKTGTVTTAVNILNTTRITSDVRTVPTRAGQIVSATFAPPQDRIEEDFPNITTQVTLHRDPISSPQHKQSSEMGPPLSVPNTMVTTATATPSKSGLSRSQTMAMPQTEFQVESAQDTQEDIRIKTVTTSMIMYKVVETVEKIKFSNGTVKILSENTKSIPIKTYHKKTETTEEYMQSSESPSRTNSTMTSGDLGDISSSMSRSGSSGPNSLEVRVGSEIPVSQTSQSLGSRRSLEKDSVHASPHQISHSDTYSPAQLDVSSIHRDADRRLSSENLFTSPDMSKEEEKRRESTGLSGGFTYAERRESSCASGGFASAQRRESSGPSEGFTCAQRSMAEPVHRKSGEESEPLFELPKPSTAESSTSGEEQQVQRLRLRVNIPSTSGESNKEISPEIPYQDQAVSTTKPDNKPENSLQQTGVVGARVMAKWKDTHFYPGMIKADIGKSRYKVQFDDGDIMVVKGSDVLLIDKLPIGQPVMVLSKDGYFYPGIITEEMKKGEVIQYTVDQDNGKTGKFRYSQVILSEDQAACLISDLQCQLSQTEEQDDIVVKNADVSLENLVTGKRRGGSRYEQLNMSTEEGKVDPEGTQPGPSGTKGLVAGTFSPTPSKKRTRGPATSTPRVSKRRKVAEVSDTAPPPQETSTSTSDDTSIASRRSPRKGKAPAKPTKLFQGMYFMLTHVKKTAVILAVEKEVLQDSSQETTDMESGADGGNEDTIEFEKDLLKTSITKEGGVLLDRIDANRKSRAQVYLISESYVRTIKYFQTLAAGFPCVSHQWIIHSIQQRKLLHYKAYTLQAGISLQKKRVVEWNAHKGDLKDMTVMLESENEKLKEEWGNILKLAEANVVYKLHAKRATEGIVQVLVTDNTCKALTLRNARSLGVPIVSTEWVIQCLVNGQQMDFTGHPWYDYDYTVV